MIENYKAWNLKEAVDYYSTTRNRPEDIYESEKVFFFPMMKKISSVLDVGCGSGGTWNIIRSINPGIRYTGVDVSEEMVGSARRLFSDAKFELTSGGELKYPPNSFDAVISLGVIHHVPDYTGFIKECYRVSKKYCLLDLPRLVPGDHTFNPKNSYMVLKERFPGDKKLENDVTRVPYVLADARPVFDFLLNTLKPERIMAKGYFGKCHKSVVIPRGEVCFTVVCIEKSNDGAGKGEIFADLPREIIERLTVSRSVTPVNSFERMLR